MTGSLFQATSATYFAVMRLERGETCGAYSSLGLILNGVLTALLTPLVLSWLGY